MIPLVSVIIPTFNRSHLISETLDSILAQTYQNWECIIVDDGSTDNTKEIVANYIKSDNRLQYFTRPNHLPKGANACRNYGFEISKGTYIQWFDSDDFMYPNLLLSKVEVFKKNPETDFLVCGIETIDDKGQSKIFNISQSSNYLEGYLNDKLILNTFNILWKRSAVSSIKWDNTIYKYQDLDFIFRVLYKNLLKGARIDKSLITVKVHSDSISKINSSKHNSSRLKVRERMYLLSQETMSSKMQMRLYHLYLFEFRNLLSLGDYELCFNSLKGKIIKRFSVKLNLLMHIFLHMLTKRGMVRLTNYLIKVST